MIYVINRRQPLKRKLKANKEIKWNHKENSTKSKEDRTKRTRGSKEKWILSIDFWQRYQRKSMMMKRKPEIGRKYLQTHM